VRKPRAKFLPEPTLPTPRVMPQRRSGYAVVEKATGTPVHVAWSRREAREWRMYRQDADDLKIERYKVIPYAN